MMAFAKKRTLIPPRTMEQDQVPHLCQAIEEMMGRQMQSPKDFELLRDRIYNRLHELISTSTLKRLWGYISHQGELRTSTLDTLAYFLGYADYAAFCQSLTEDGGLPSNPIVSRHISVRDDLVENDQLTLFWQPGRVCRVRYLGNLQFQVLSSEKTRLREGDYFQCSLIVEGEPLYLTNLLQNGRLATNYVCGRRGGVRFER